MSASVPPTTINSTTGTLSWADVGPVNAGAARVITTTFKVREPLSNATQSNVTNTATVTNALFANGLAANDDSGVAVFTVNPRGTISGAVWSEGTGGTNGWVGTTGYQPAFDHFVPGVTVQLLACQASGANVFPAISTTKSCTSTGASGNNGAWTVVQTTTTSSTGTYAFSGFVEWVLLRQFGGCDIAGNGQSDGRPRRDVWYMRCVMQQYVENVDSQPRSDAGHFDRERPLKR